MLFPERTDVISPVEISALMTKVGLSAGVDDNQEPLPHVNAVALLARVLQLIPGARFQTGHDRGESWVCLGYRDPVITRNALVLSLHAIDQVAAPSVRLIADLKRLIAWARRRPSDHITELLKAEADARGIPYYSVSFKTRIQQFGQGENGQPDQEDGHANAPKP